MFNEQQYTKLAKNLNLLDAKNAEKLAFRLHNWIEANGNTKLSIVKGLNTILKDLKQKEMQNINLLGTFKNNEIFLKYGLEIVKLHKQGLGARLIAKHLLEKHNKKISHTTIYKFLKLQK